VNSDDRLEVIDGQQRLMSVKYFLEGLFGEEDANGRRQVFKLKGLSERSELRGKTFHDLTEKDQRRFRNSTLRAINIKQLKPSFRNDSVFHIFERLNTGGTQLKPQEIRNAVYRGPIVDQLSDLNRDPNWRRILGAPLPDKNQKDVELVLRLFSLFEYWSEYEKPMLSYLNKMMDQNRQFSSERAREFVKRFKNVTELVSGSLHRPFRPRGVINAAVLEAVMVTLLENPAVDKSFLPIKYERLLSDPKFMRIITGATTDTLVLKERLRLAREILTDATH